MRRFLGLFVPAEGPALAGRLSPVEADTDTDTDGDRRPAGLVLRGWWRAFMVLGGGGAGAWASLSAADEVGVGEDNPTAAAEATGATSSTEPLQEVPGLLSWPEVAARDGDASPVMIAGRLLTVSVSAVSAAMLPGRTQTHHPALSLVGKTKPIRTTTAALSWFPFFVLLLFFIFILFSFFIFIFVSLSTGAGRCVRFVIGLPRAWAGQPTQIPPTPTGTHTTDTPHTPTRAVGSRSLLPGDRQTSGLTVVLAATVRAHDGDPLTERVGAGQSDARLVVLSCIVLLLVVQSAVAGGQLCRCAGYWLAEKFCCLARV